MILDTLNRSQLPSGHGPVSGIALRPEVKDRHQHNPQRAQEVPEDGADVDGGAFSGAEAQSRKNKFVPPRRQERKEEVLCFSWRLGGK